jgi:hypothetical protein
MIHHRIRDKSEKKVDLMNMGHGRVICN